MSAFNAKMVEISVVIDKRELELFHQRTATNLYGFWPYDRIVFPRWFDDPKLMWNVMDTRLRDSYTTMAAYVDQALYLKDRES